MFWLEENNVVHRRVLFQCLYSISRLEEENILLGSNNIFKLGYQNDVVYENDNLKNTKIIFLYNADYRAHGNTEMEFDRVYLAIRYYRRYMDGFYSIIGSHVGYFYEPAIVINFESIQIDDVVEDVNWMKEGF